MSSLIPLCPVEQECGACQNLRIPYDKQLAHKQKQIVQLFGPLLHQSDIVRPILGMEYPYHYRNKVISPYVYGRKLPAREENGKKAKRKTPAFGKKVRRNNKGSSMVRREILTGMYAAHSHRLVPTDTCYLENEIAKDIILAVRDIMVRFHMEPYSEDSGVGFVRHVVVRVGHTSNEVLVTIVTNAREFPSSRAFCRELVRRCPAVTTVVQNVNMRQTNVILGEEEKVLYGPGFILDTLCGLSFRISSRSFYQVNALQTAVLYEQALQLAALNGNETVIDAYCGTGTIGLVAAKHGAASVVGVDSVDASIRDARENARHNGVENARFIVADAAKFMRGFAAERRQGIDSARDVCEQEEVSVVQGASSGVVERTSPVSLGEKHNIHQNHLVLLMDPPRAGASKDFLESAVVLAPHRIVYISCNPQTQVRDVAFLCEHGYELAVIQPVDMFPHTNHVETVCLLSKLNARGDNLLH